jgi:hypothetical protein
MRSKLLETEFKLWLETVPEQRSLLVEVLHWFHYRPAALKRSWAREETITWELLRVFEILPQTIFLRPVLRHLAGLSAEARKAIDPLLAARSIIITRYPSLKLTGSKRNCRSDIGFGLDDGPSVWVEAKTAPFKNADLQAQLLQQQKALANIFTQQPIVIITLLPWDVVLPDIPNISWNQLAELLEQSIITLANTLPEEYRSGYDRLATEMLGRIRSHPNKITGSILSPNNSLHRTHPRAPRSARRPPVRR